MFYFRQADDDRPLDELPRFTTVDEIGDYLSEEAEARAEIEVEARYERWLENGGAHAAAIQADLELDDRMYGRGGF